MTCVGTSVTPQSCLPELLPNLPLWDFKHAASGGAHMAEFVVLLACPLGPIPLAARGLPAVLARAGPAGAVVKSAPVAAGDAGVEAAARANPLCHRCRQAPPPFHSLRTGAHPVEWT